MKEHYCNCHSHGAPGEMVVPKSDYEVLAAQLADWQRMRNEAMAVAMSNRDRIRALEAQNAALLADVNQDEGYERLKARNAKLEAALKDISVWQSDLSDAKKVAAWALLSQSETSAQREADANS